MAKWVKLTIDGCDDSTVVEASLTVDKIEFLNRIINVVNSKAKNNCQPTIKLEEIEL